MKRETSITNDPALARSPERESERIRREIADNEPNYHDDPPGNVLVEENPEAPNGIFGDHEDDFDTG